MTYPTCSISRTTGAVVDLLDGCGDDIAACARANIRHAALLSEANDAIGAARDAMNAARVGSKAWRDASEDLDWWIGRKAFVTAMPTQVAR